LGRLRFRLLFEISISEVFLNSISCPFCRIGFCTADNTFLFLKHWAFNGSFAEFIYNRFSSAIRL
jgi:hypothetical protein